MSHRTSEWTKYNYRLHKSLTQVVVAPPYHLHGLVSESGPLVLIIDPAQEQAVIPHGGQQRGQLSRVPERVDLPANPRQAAVTESLVQFAA